MVEFGAFLCHEEGQVFKMFADRHAATLFKAWLAVMVGQHRPWCASNVAASVLGSEDACHSV